MKAVDHLRSVALEWLVRPEEAPTSEPPRYARQRVRLWHHPSLRGPWISLFLYEGDARRFQPPGMSPLFEVTWDRDADVKLVQMADPTARAPETPSVTWRQCLVATETVRRCHEALQHLALPAVLAVWHRYGWLRSRCRSKTRIRDHVDRLVGEGPDGFEPLAQWYAETWNNVQREMETAQQGGLC